MKIIPQQKIGIVQICGDKPNISKKKWRPGHKGEQAPPSVATPLFRNVGEQRTSSGEKKNMGPLVTNNAFSH